MPELADYGTHLERLRDAIEALEALVEQDLAELVPEAQPDERATGRGPVAAVADEFGVERDDLNHALKLVRTGDESAVGGSADDSAE